MENTSVSWTPSHRFESPSFNNNKKDSGAEHEIVELEFMCQHDRLGLYIYRLVLASSLHEVMTSPLILMVLFDSVQVTSLQPLPWA